MTISMQGSWTVSVKSKEAAWPQHFRIVGSSNGADGTYTDTSPAIYVTGAQWGVTVEHNPPGPSGWRASRHRLANFSTAGGAFRFDILTNDKGGDEDFNDLILTCTADLGPWDHIVYGTVRTYTGHCHFNPCFPRPYIVVDSLQHLLALLAIRDTREILKKLYPQRVKPLLRRPPEPDPGPFRPLMIPTGLVDEPGIDIVRLAERKQIAEKERAASGMTPAKTSNKPSVALAAGTATVSAVSAWITRDDLLSLGRFKDKFVKPCLIRDASQVILRFLEYDRTGAERMGEPYNGEGNRAVLGITGTDETGNYIFRFTQTPEMVVEENADIGESESYAEAIKPDLIVQVLESLPDDMSYESAPYYNIAGIKRINLCIPDDRIHRPPSACQGGHAIQRLGNLFVHVKGTTFHADGTVSSTVSTGPAVDHAAWYNIIDLFACFLDLKDPRVEYYTIEYCCKETDTTWTAWDFVAQYYEHPRKQIDGTWKNAKVGPDFRSLRVNSPGDPKKDVPSYLNIEDQLINQDWMNSARDRKLQLDTTRFNPASHTVKFRIQGYAQNGEKIIPAKDDVTLYIDNSFSTGDIIFAKPEGSLSDLGECSMYSIMDPDIPFRVRFRVRDTEGFLTSYALKVYYGSNKYRNTEDILTHKAVLETFRDLDPTRFDITKPDRFFGTPDMAGIDDEGYVELTIQPVVPATWIPEGRTSCCFSFELSSLDRLTNGYGGPGWRTLWQELIGISHVLPP